MKPVVVSAKQFIADIRSGKTDQSLMRDYRLSPAGLLNLKNELLARRLISLTELKNQMGPVRTRKKINPERFLYDFRQHPDDLYLMGRYGLKPYQLKKVYLSLMKQHLLSEFEYESRDVRVPAVDEERRPAPSVGQVGEASTVVSVVGEFDDPQAEFVDRYRDSQLPAEFFRDYSGVSIGKNSLPDIPDFGRPPEQPGHHDTKDMGGHERTVVEIIGADYCPNCGALKNSASEDTCLSCGVIFAKARSVPGVIAGAVWKGK